MCSLTQRSKSSLSLHNCHCLGKRLSSFAGKTRIPAVDSPQNRKECHLSSVFSFCDISHVRQLFGCVATRATLQRSPRKPQQLLDWHCTCWSSAYGHYSALSKPAEKKSSCSSYLLKKSQKIQNGIEPK